MIPAWFTWKSCETTPFVYVYKGKRGITNMYIHVHKCNVERRHLAILHSTVKGINTSETVMLGICHTPDQFPAAIILETQRHFLACVTLSESTMQLCKHMKKPCLTLRIVSLAQVSSWLLGKTTCAEDCRRAVCWRIVSTRLLVRIKLKGVVQHFLSWVLGWLFFRIRRTVRPG